MAEICILQIRLDQTEDRGAIESRKVQQNFLFSKIAQPDPGVHPAFIQWVPGLFTGVKAAGA
jgi:hypothetical protein